MYNMFEVIYEYIRNLKKTLKYLLNIFSLIRQYHGPSSIFDMNSTNQLYNRVIVLIQAGSKNLYSGKNYKNIAIFSVF
jgi:hypothetical protein